MAQARRLAPLGRSRLGQTACGRVHRRHAYTWIGAEFATAIRRMLVRENDHTLELFRAVPDHWWDGDGIILQDLPTSFGNLNLSAHRHGSQVTIDLALTGPAPARIVVRCPGARQAIADAQPCAIEGDLIEAPNSRRLR
ncbi:MAG: hypothetical protein MZV65_14860 [Chromatiales bacterium]|nr:hypothetical protein [Chromatiales bacterium]